MLHLARWIALGVNIRNLFQFQCALQRDGEVDATTEIQKIGCAEKFFRELLDAVRIVQQMFEFDGQLSKFLSVKACFFLRKHATQLAQVQAEQIECDHLCGKRFGRSDTDLRTSVRQNRSVSLAHDHRSLYVADRQHSRTEFLGFTQRRDRVGRFS